MKLLLPAFVVLLALVFLVPGMTNAQTYSVKFVVNTATVPDTVVPTSNVTIIGGSPNDAAANTALGNWATAVPLTYAGGDYWTKTLTFNANAELRFKIRIYDSGWEDNLTPNNDRTVIVTKDTVLAVEYWNNGNFAPGKNPGYFATPWATQLDSMISIWVRVNMKGISDNGTYGWTAADKDSVCILGGFPAGSNVGDWGGELYLKQEKAPTNSPGAFLIPPTSFYSGQVLIPKSKKNPGDVISYKFRLGSNWSYGTLQRSEQISSNRTFTIPDGYKDTTVAWVWFADAKPSGRSNTDTVKVSFRAKLTKTAADGGFDLLNDTLVVRSGYFSTGQATREKRMLPAGGGFFTATDTVVTAKGQVLDYQYYVIRNATDVRENYYNFYYSGDVSSEAEKRQITVPTSASLTTALAIFDTATAVVNPRRQPEFPNGRKLVKKVTVRYEVDIRPAYYLLKGGDSLFDAQSAFRTLVPADKDSLTKWGVWINGLAVGGWGNPNGDWGLGLRENLTKKMYDNGTNGDRVVGDSIFTRFVVVSPDSVNLGSKDVVGQIFKFGLYGGDNEGGRGGFGNNHNANVQDNGPDTVTIASQFGSINPAYYRFWDYDLVGPKLPTAVGVETTPLVYNLAQNYPNPFNPSTQIVFSLPKQSKVELKVFNILGQEVATLLNEVRPAGVHNVRFNAQTLASGMYLYRIVAGEFTSVKKMLLMK